MQRQAYVLASIGPTVRVLGLLSIGSLLALIGELTKVVHLSSATLQGSSELADSSKGRLTRHQEG